MSLADLHVSATIAQRVMNEAAVELADRVASSAKANRERGTIPAADVSSALAKYEEAKAAHKFAIDKVRHSISRSGSRW